MIYGYDENGKKIHINDYEKGMKVFCPDGHELIGKKGKIRKHHFAHKSKRDCKYGNNMGTWHAKEQARIKDEYLEVRMGHHIADVYTAQGLVVEYQNSIMNVDTIRERESFYGNMIWIFHVKMMGFSTISKSGDRIKLKQTSGSKFWQSATKRSFLDQGKRGLLEVLSKRGQTFECKIWSIEDFDNTFLKGCVKDDANMRKFKHKY